MSYPKRNLNPNESIALDLHPHWWYFAEPATAVIVAIVLSLLTVVADTVDGLKLLMLGLLAVAALWLFGRYLKWVTTNFVITSSRIIFRQGVFAKSGIEIPLERVNNVNFNQTLFERILNAGDLLIESGGEDGQQRFTDIRHPDRVQNLIHAQIEALIGRRIGGSAPASNRDVTEQLERLEGLRDRGSLTADEFEEQKRRLLGRS